MTQPILLLGASLEAARNAGADAGLVKPLRFADLLRQLAQWTSRPSIAVGSFRLDASARQMTNAQGQSLRLTEKETAILSYLAQAGDQAVAREELLGQVWGYAGSATTHTVETHIYRLRRKLQENGGIDLLHTEGGGYRLARP
jgi:DNA-binding response OmpR family regulator